MEFKDKKGRNIRLEENFGTIYAYCVNEGEDVSVGYIQFQICEYPQANRMNVCVAYPEQMHIKEEYQRNGIATEIIKYAKELYDVVLFSPDTGCGGNTDEIHYSSEGLAFKNFCEMSGIIKDSSDYEDEDFEM